MHGTSHQSDIQIQAMTNKGPRCMGYKLGMATSTRLTGYSIKHPIIEYQNRYSVTRKTFFYENNVKIFRTINN